MSFHMPPQPPGASDQQPLSMTAPNADEKFAVPQGGIDRDALKKRKASKSRPSDLRRTASTPHLGKVAPGDGGMLSPTSDKKRNKLGYHRSSIACSHCRRRKIRCQLPLPEDAQGRCTNCIRLKKECNFYPVDQAPNTDNRPPQPARRDTAMSGAPSASSQSSPHISGASQPGSVADDASHLRTHSPKTDPELRQPREAGGYPLPPGNVHNSPYHFTSPSTTAWGDQQHSMHSYPQSQRSSIAEPQYWSVNSTPTTAHYNHDSSVPFSATTPTTFASPNFAYTHGGNPSFAPARSMSFGHIEGMSQHYSYQGVQFGHQEPQAPYAMPPHQTFAHPAPPPQQVLSSMTHHGSPPEAVPRSWSTAPNVPATGGAYPPHHLQQNSYYPHSAQQPTPIEAYDGKANTVYQQHGQYYPASSNPG